LVQLVIRVSHTDCHVSESRSPSVNPITTWFSADLIASHRGHLASDAHVTVFHSTVSFELLTYSLMTYDVSVFDINRYPPTDDFLIPRIPIPRTHVFRRSPLYCVFSLGDARKCLRYPLVNDASVACAKRREKFYLFEDFDLFRRELDTRELLLQPPQ